MVLTPAQLKEIFKNRPSKNIIDAAQAYSKRMIMHMTGVGLDEYIEAMTFFEKPELSIIRKKYAKSNKSLFARLHRPIDKVFNARGGSVYYKLPENKEMQLRQALAEVEYGYSLRKWIEAIWLKPYHYDPMSLVFIEVDQNGEAYPTIKSVFDLFEIKTNGRYLEYVILKTPDKEVFRVIDDAFDKLYKWDGTSLREIRNDSFPNYFGKVPAIIVSDIYDPIRGYYISPDDAIVEDADQFLMEGSVFNIFKKYHGFPKAWMYQSSCPKCKGTGKLEGKDCPDCSGTGQKVNESVAETIRIPVPQSKDHPILAPDLGGYITPSIEGWDAQRDSLKELEDLMHWTFWGTHRQEKADNNTATGEFIDAQPVNERLNKFSDAAEDVETWITNMIGSFMFGGYNDADINYGRRYLVETPDQVWLKYEGARTKGAPMSTLNDILLEYYHTKYKGDSIGMTRQVKLMKLEPLVHNTISEAKNLLTSYPEEYTKKLYFNEWVTTLTDMEIIQKDLKTLRQDLNDYVIGLNLKPVVEKSGATILN